MDLIQEYFKKYHDEVVQEQLIRDTSFLTDYEYIGNIQVYSLTPKLLATLTLSKCPIIGKESITNESILIFLWMVSVKDTNISQTEFFENILNTENVDELITDIKQYFENSFMDQLSGNDEKQTVPYYSYLSSIVDLLASEYGWKENDIINIPYKRLHQYMKIIIKRKNPDKILFNKSDSVKSELARKLNNI